MRDRRIEHAALNKGKYAEGGEWHYSLMFLSAEDRELFKRKPWMRFWIAVVGHRGHKRPYCLSSRYEVAYQGLLEGLEEEARQDARAAGMGADTE